MFFTRQNDTILFMKSQDLKKLKMPDSPGVYFFQKGKDILYIGKATSLRDRVKSYFPSTTLGMNALRGSRGQMILDMVFKAGTIKWQETDSVLEALILEANLIKKYKPYYNTKEKDDKSWNYVCITKEDLPQVIIERGKNIDFKNQKTDQSQFQALYGPFISGVVLKEAMKIIRRIFPYIDSSSIQKDKYEFYRQLGLTPDVADTRIKNEYQKTIKNIKLFFEGKKKKIVSALKKEMVAAAKHQEFERANEIKKKIFALEHIHDVALLKDDPTAENRQLKAGFRIESYDIAHMSGQNMVGVMTVVSNGAVDKNEYRKFIIRTQGSLARTAKQGGNDTGALEEIFSRRFRHTEWGMPDLVVVDGGEAQLNVARRVLKRYQLAIPIVSVLKDDRHKPKALLGDEELARKYKKAILLANSEAHRFGITFHKKKRAKSFLH